MRTWTINPSLTQKKKKKTQAHYTVVEREVFFNFVGKHGLGSYS